MELAGFRRFLIFCLRGLEAFLAGVLRGRRTGVGPRRPIDSRFRCGLEFSGSR